MLAGRLLPQQVGEGAQEIVGRECGRVFIPRVVFLVHCRRVRVAARTGANGPDSSNYGGPAPTGNGQVLGRKNWAERGLPNQRGWLCFL